MYFDQGVFDIRLEWGLAAIEHLARGQVAVVVDILSFTTCIDVALTRGATVFPYAWRDEDAHAYAVARGAVLAGARDQLGGGYSLSPASLLEAPAGLRLVLPSPNGSAISFAARSGAMRVVAGSLRNAAQVAAWAERGATQIVVIPAGERWPNGSLRPAVEDWLGAGAIVSRLSGRRSPEADAAAAAFERVADRLVEPVSSCSSGRELIERGFRRDVELACALDVSRTVPVLDGDAFVDMSRNE